jgi:omega-6 fatty acid desaturase (delta-12 desaturase)
MNTSPAQVRPDIAEWKAAIAKYRQPSFWRASWQILNTLGGYFLVWSSIFLSLAAAGWITLSLAVLAGGLLVRVFIIFHDCSHGSYFRSRRANNFWGLVCGALTFTPFFRWRRRHALHHATSGNLDRRGTGDIWTLTVQEYRAASRWQRLAYHVVRNPAVMFGIGPLLLMLGIERVPAGQDSPRERRSVWWMNLAILGVAAGLGSAIGFVNYLLVQLMVILVAGSAGVWLFYVQHQVAGTYWARSGEWDCTTAALRGSSYYQLPKVLQWFSGNIGFHHIHHLNPSIPNYYLERCQREAPLSMQVNPLTMLASLKSLSLHLWDESGQRFVGYRHILHSQPGAAGGDQSHST